jgi:N utilization substance protein A
VRDEIGSQEMIDIVVWDEDKQTFVANAMKPANVTKVNIKGDKATVIVPEDQLSIAIGKAGQNVRLAGKLTGYELDVEADKAGAAKHRKPRKKSSPRPQRMSNPSQSSRS